MNARDRFSILERLSKATTRIMRNPGGISLQRRLTLITKLATELLNAEASQILLVTRRGFLSLEASYGHRKGKFKKGKEFAIRTGRKTGLTGHIAFEGEVFKAHGSALSKHPAVRGVQSDHLRSGACVSLLAMPLKKKTERGERLIGLLRAENKQGLDGRPSPRLGFDKQDEWILNIFAEAIAVAIENAELVNQQKVQKDLLERLFTSSPDGVIAADERGFVIQYNRQAEHILGYTAKEAVKKFHVSKFYADPREPALIKRRLNARKGAPLSRHELQLVGRDGEIIPVSLSASWLHDSKGARIGSVGYFEDLRSAREKDKHLDLLLKASNTVSRAKTVGEGLQRFAKMLVSLIPCGFCRILLFDESRQNLVPKAAYPEPGGPLKWNPGLDEPLDVSRWPELSGWLEEGRPRLISARDPQHKKRLADISGRMQLAGDVESMLLVPLKVEGAVVGVLDLGEVRGSERGAFTAKRIKLVGAIAAQTAVLIHRIRLFEDSERHNRLLTAMDDALQHIRAEKDPPKLLQEFVRLAAELVGCRAGGLFIRDPSHQGQPLLTVTYRLDHKLVGGRLARPDGIIAQVLETGEAQLVGDYVRGQKREPALTSLDFKRVIAIPLTKAGEVEAVLFIGDESGRARLSYDSVDVLKRFVARSSVALHTAELMTSEQRMFDQLRILHKISDYIQAAEKLDDILFVVVTGVTAGYGLGFNRAALFLLDERGEWLEGKMGIGHHAEGEAHRAWKSTHKQGLYDLDRLLATMKQRHVPPTPLARLIPGLRVPVHGRGRDPLSRAVLAGPPARVARLPPSRLRELPHELLDVFRPDSEVALVPLVSGEKPIGLLVADNKFTRMAITPEDESALEMFATTAAIAIDNFQWTQQTEATAERLRSSFIASAALTSDKDPNGVLNAIVERIRLDANATWVSMVLIDEAGRARSSYPSSPKGNPDIAVIMREEGNSMRVMRTGQPAIIEDVTDPRHGFNRAMLQHGGIASALCLPVSLHDVRIGVMWMHYAERRSFPPSDIEAWQLYVNHTAIAYDNARRMDTQRRMRKADEDFARAADLKALRRQIVDSALEVMQAEAALLWPYDSAREVFVTGESVASGVPAELWAEFKSRGPHPNGTTYEVLARKFIEVGDTHGRQAHNHIGPTTRRLLGKLGAERFLGIALSQGRERLGVLYLDYKHPRKFGRGGGFSREEREMARTFANHAALALKKAKLIEDFNLAHKTARVVAEVTTLGKLDDTLRSVVKGTRKALGCDAVTLYEFDPVKKRLRPRPVMEKVGDERGALQLPEVQPESIVSFVLRRREMLIVKDATTDPLLKNSRFAKDERVATCVGIPLIAENSKVGVMFVNYCSPHQFTPLERENFKLFASQAAVAISNAQLYEREQRRTRALEALYKAGREVSGSLDESKILARITEQAWRISISQGKPANFADIRMVRGDKLALEAIYPRKTLRTSLAQIGAEIDLGRGAGGIGIIGRTVLASRRDPDYGSEFVPDVKEDGDYIPFHDATRAELVVPIRIGREVIGAINVEHPDPNAFDEIDRRTFESLAAQASVAIENGRQYAALEAKTLLAWMGIPNATWSHDCRKYARHIYDSAKEVREELHKGDAGDQHKADSDLKVVRRLASKIMKGPLTPGSDDHVDICQLIEWQLNDLRRCAPADRPLNCQLTGAPKGRKVFVKGSRNTLALALKYLCENSVEAMAESSRRELRVDVRVGDRRVEIFVVDKGKGIPRDIKGKIFEQPIRKSKGAKGLGVGLLQTGAIIQAHDGNIRLKSTGPKGTTMHVSLPLLSEREETS